MIKKELIEDGQTVVLGLSGGPDSVCLLYEVLALGNPVICAHVNHGLRGEESDGDEKYVSAICERLGVPLEILRIDVAALAKEKGLTVEEAGRHARYDFFDEICEKHGGDIVIAVAHNRDDQSETVLMRILRGTGTDGLAGIPSKRKSASGFDIVRPLLGTPRADIERKLEEYGESARTDSSNKESVFLRNKLRLEAFPYLEEHLGLDLRQGLLRLSENASEDKDFFDAVVEEAIEEYLEYPEEHNGDGPVTQGDGPFVSFDTKGPSPCVTGPSPCVTGYLPVELLAGIHPAIRHRLIRAVFAELGLDRNIAAVHLAAADSLLTTWQDGGEASGKRVEFPRDYTFGINGKKAVFRSPEAIEPGWKPRRKL